jgi:2-haloacid dehalogenase
LPLFAQECSPKSLEGAVSRFCMSPFRNRSRVLLLSPVLGLADRWLPFPDTVIALRARRGRYRLAIILNRDDGLFALTAWYLEVEFDYIVTAEQVGTYKPSPNNFELALKGLGVAPERILHVAESLFHDHAPAQGMGLDTAWIHRRAAKGGFGATPLAEAQPDLEVPDLESLVHALGVRES